MIMDVDIVSSLASFIVATRVELLLFFAAVIAYFALFGNALPKDQRREQKIKAKIEPTDREQSSPDKLPPIDTEDCDQLEKSFQVAFENGDHRSVLRCWNTMKKFGKVPAVPLTQVIESMQRFKKDTPFIIRELKTYFKKYPTECDMSLVNDLLESLSKRLDSDLMEKIVEILHSIELKSDQRTYEIFLNMYFTTRNFQEVKSLVAEMTANQVPFTTRSTIVVIKTALKLNNFEEALRYFRELKAVWTGHVAGSPTASMAPRHIVSQLVELACKEHQLSEFLPELSGVPVTEDIINVMLTECVRQKDASLAMQVEKLAKTQEIALSDTTYGLMVRGFSNDPAKVQQLFDDVLSRSTEHSAEFILAIISFCNQTGNVVMVDKLYTNTKSKQLPVLSAFIRFYADNEQYEKACDVFEKDLKAAHVANGPDAHRSLFLDARMERSLMNAALRCGRDHLAKNLLDSSPSDIAKHITMIRNCAAEGNLQGAMSVFESLKKSGVDLNSVIYNTVLDACVECRDLRAAEKWMEETKEAGMADVVSFNTLIKAHLKNDNFDKARSLMEEMKQKNLQPNRVTFNELINAMVMKGGASRRSQIWDLVAEMREAGVKPNQVTCSILMKNLNGHSQEDDIMKTMELINMTDEPMDEVLLSSVVEACVRIGKPDLLASKLQQLQGNGNIAVTGSHTFGSLIKAYGRARDIDGVWRCWKEMRSRHIKPTCITLGCMVEAVVSNGDTEGAYELIHQMQDDEQCREALNSVIYCSVLKGFTREKKMERVWAVYEEMNKKKIEFSIVTYNTLIDACARCGRMEHVPEILEDMKERRIKPNVITYSTMLKGHCQMGNIQTGFQILAEMKRDARLRPDEIMYNSLLDGCAQNNLVDEGLRLLEEMQTEQVAPSNFTLSILVKLMNRARKLDGAFNIVRDITAKYNFKANVHVHTNLVQACVSNRQLPRAFGVLETMVKERIQPESRTYAILIRASISHRHYDQAAGLLRAALGLHGAFPVFLAEAHASAVCPNLDFALVNETLAALADSGRSLDIASPLLADIKQYKSKVRIDPNVQRRIVSAGVGPQVQQESHPWAQRAPKGNGKGRDTRGYY